MTTLLYVAIVAEMLIVNLSTCHLCAEKKYSIPTIVASLIAYSLFIIAVFMAIISKFSFYGNGNGAFVLVGFLYLPVLKFLYKDSLLRIIELICSAWIYTLLAFMLSVHIAKLFDPLYFTQIVFATQSIFYICTAYFFWNFIRKKFLYILQNISTKIRRYLLISSISWFLALVAVNLSFISTKYNLFKVIALAFLAMIAWVSYSLIFEITRSNLSALKMEKIANTDYLTKLPNRYNLSSNINQKIEDNQPFSLLFIDLNKFKTVNDRYGHLIGDRYLVKFAECMQSSLANIGSLYRVSGDEFLFLNNTACPKECEKLIRDIYFGNPQTVEFLGVSIGVAIYPQDGTTCDTLLAVADNRMYKDKAKCNL